MRERSHRDARNLQNHTGGSSPSLSGAMDRPSAVEHDTQGACSMEDVFATPLTRRRSRTGLRRLSTSMSTRRRASPRRGGHPCMRDGLGGSLAPTTTAARPLQNKHSSMTARTREETFTKKLQSRTLSNPSLAIPGNRGKQRDNTSRRARTRRRFLPDNTEGRLGAAFSFSPAGSIFGAVA